MRLLPRVLVRLHTVEQPQHTWLTSLARRLRRLAGLGGVASLSQRQSAPLSRTGSGEH